MASLLKHYKLHLILIFNFAEK